MNPSFLTNPVLLPTLWKTTNRAKYCQPLKAKVRKLTMFTQNTFTPQVRRLDKNIVESIEISKGYHHTR